MQRNIWSKLKATVSFWQAALPGAIVIGLVIAARLTGSLQGLELLALDAFLRLRPTEPEDDRIVLVGIDEADIQTLGYPIPEQALVDLITTLQTYKPTVIGLHVLQNQIAKPENTRLFATLKQRQDLIVSDLILDPAAQIQPPAVFPDKQVGFIDILIDEDAHLRHMILGISDPINLETYRISLPVRLAEKYLVSQDENLKLLNGIRDPDAMRFGNTELPRLGPNSGAYVGVDMGDPELLLNFRNNPHPFRQLSLNQIKARNFDPGWLRDRIVIVGITDPKIRPNIPTATISDTNSLQIQAHTISQIISAVLDRRLLLTAWTDQWEYLWILGWGCLAIVLGHSVLRPQPKLIAVGMGQAGIVGLSYLLFVGGWWIPVIPASLVWLLNGIGYTAFYKYDWVLRSRLKDNQILIEERQRTIEETFNVIHNGPLQTLASLLRKIQDHGLSQEHLLLALENLNTEVRRISEHLKQETMTQENSLYLGSGTKIDLKLPIHELFYEVYSSTLERPDIFSSATLRVAYQFDPIEQSLLSIEQKRNLCRFLEEALCNVGKHAVATNQLSITGTQRKGWYILQVTDNGTGIQSLREGEGTRYACKLAAQLRGRFRRVSLSPKGTCCELTFPLTYLASLFFWQR